MIFINNKRIEQGIKEAMSATVLNRMPTSTELRGNGFQWLDSLIGKNGGLVYWAEKLGLETKNSIKRYTDEEAKSSILEAMTKLNINRMPSRSELMSVNLQSLHNHISRGKGYRKIAEEMSLEIKYSETKLGQDYEVVATSILKDKGFKVEEMSTKHPFDLLVNDTVKIDVKVARAHSSRKESSLHTFGINKKHGTCDIYMAIALDIEDNIEKCLVIPSHHLKVVTLSIGKNSKYDIYNNQFKYIKKYSDFYKSI